MYDNNSYFMRLDSAFESYTVQNALYDESVDGRAIEADIPVWEW